MNGEGFRRWLGRRKTQYACVVVAAFAVALINVWPHVVLTTTLQREGEIYAPYTMRGNYDMANVVGPRLKEVLEGNTFVSEVDLYEYKNAPAFLPMAAESYAFFVRPFTDTVGGVVMSTDAFLSAAIFFLIYIASFLLTGRRVLLSVFTALLVSLYREIAIHIPPPTAEFIGVMWRTVNPFVASPNSYFLDVRQAFMPGALPLLATFICLILTLRSSRLWWQILGGLALAGTAYTYPYHFLYASAVCGVLFVFVVATKEYVLIKRLCVFGAVALVALVPFSINYFAVTHLAQYPEIFARYGPEIGRGINFENWKRYLMCLGVAALVWKWGRVTSHKTESLVVCAMLVASILVLNIQVILGFSIHTDHWLNRDIVWAFTFAYIALLGWGMSALKARYPLWVMQGVVAVGMVILVGTAINSVRSTYLLAADAQDLFTLAPQERSLFDWLNANTQPEDVVMTPSLVRNTYIPLYTHNNIYIPRALNTVAPDSEMIERLFITYRVFGISDSFLRRILLSDSTALPRNDGVLYAEGTDEYYETAGSYYLFHFKHDLEIADERRHENGRRLVPYDKADALLEEFKNFSCVDGCLSSHRVDYVVMGDRERMLSDVSFENTPLFERVGGEDGWVVYRVVKTAE